MAATTACTGQTPSPLDHATMLWHMGDGGASAGGCRLATHGDVTLGVQLGGGELAESLRRGGDGKAARLDGGYLSLTDDAALAINREQWAVAIRMHDPSGTWLYPILGSYGSDGEVSMALRALDGRRVMEASARSSIQAWMFRAGGPRSVGGSQSLLEAVWGAEEPNTARRHSVPGASDPNATPRTLAGDVRNAVMRVCYPVQLLDPTAWHDIVVCFTGPTLQLWVDGVLLDEEFPIGVTRPRALPFLIGAGQESGELKAGFHGLIDHVAVWDRALTGEEITAVSGGAEHVRGRELTILGDESPGMQYFRPRGHNRKAGDCIPYWDARTNTFRLFYLILRRNHHSKWDAGHGALEIWQASTQDLREWKHHPATLPITEQWEAWNGTGGVGYHDGVYHWFYPTPDYDTDKGGVQHAVSTDGVHFEKTVPHPFMRGGDCEIYEDDAGLFHMIKAGPVRQAQTPTLREKTLVAWVRLADLDQRGGSVLTVEHPDGRQFDAIVFGERCPRRWMPGSDMFQRTPARQESWPEETAAPGEVVQIAVAYAGKRVTLYRNGSVYTEAAVRQPAVFPSGSSLIIGLRHTTASPRSSRFHGSVLDARVYGSALAEAELRTLRPNESDGSRPLAWYDFANSGLRDRTGTFPDGTPDGSAQIVDGELRLDESGCFRSLGSVTTLSRLTSGDLLEWTPVDEPFIETDVRSVVICPHLFRFGDWHYFIGGNQWFRSRNEFGPWTPHEPRRLCDLHVPKTAPFGPERRIYAGFLRDGGWGGNEVLRELVQDEAGWLGTRFVPEMVPASGEALPVTFLEHGKEATDTVRLVAAGGGRAEARIPDVPQDARIQLEVVPEAGACTVGLELCAGPRPDAGCVLSCDLNRGEVAFSKRTDSAGNAQPGPVIRGVRNLDRAFTLDVICRHDVIDAEIGGFRATCTRFWNPEADRVRLFAEGGTATFRDIRIRCITESYAPYPPAGRGQEGEP